MKKTLFITILLIAGGLYLQDYWSSEKNEDSITKMDSEEVSHPAPLNPKVPNKVVTPVKAVELKQQPILTQKTTKYPQLTEEFVPFDEDGNRYITQVVQSGRHLIYHGDVLLGDAKDLPQLQKLGVIKKAKPQLWPQGKIPYSIDDNLENYEQILEAIEYLNQNTNIDFIPHESQKDYVLFTGGDSDCYSYVGRIGGKQEIFLTPLCGIKEIIHELMHTIGFFHEQNREDRDQYIEVMWNNIDEIHHTQFKKIPNDFLGVINRPFDIQSIMMYSSFTFSLYPDEPALLTRRGDLVHPSDRLLSDEDILRINHAYPNP